MFRTLTGDIAVIDLTDTTKIERKRDFRLRDAKMVTALVPGLTIDVDGVGNAKGQLDASKVTFDPNVFAIEVAEEQQIQANQTADEKQILANQAAANQAQTSANVAQASADVAQASANQAGQAAVAAGVVALTDA